MIKLGQSGQIWLLGRFFDSNYHSPINRGASCIPSMLNYSAVWCVVCGVVGVGVVCGVVCGVVGVGVVCGVRRGLVWCRRGVVWCEVGGGVVGWCVVWGGVWWGFGG